MEESDYIFFAGDGIFGVTRTLENVADKLYAVGGNCDNSLYPEELVVDVEKVNLVYRAKEVGADCVCFGHTHSYSDETYDDVRLINDGSFSHSVTGDVGYVYIVVEGKNIFANFVKTGDFR